MGTRSTIGMLHDNGTVTSIYCHWDGYPSHHAPILTGSYGTADRVRALVALGDLSQLGHALGDEADSEEVRLNPMCVAYARDRGEPLRREIHASERAFDRAADHDYAYLFKEGRWYARSRRGDWTPAEQLAAEWDDE